MSTGAKLPLILAIESAVRGGSISLHDGLTEIGSTIGEGSSSRAEELLGDISALLKQHGAGLDDITTLAVSVGPGSYTGIRIGLATALGLKTALKIPCLGFAVSEAMSLATDSASNKITAVPIGRDSVCIQHISSGAKEPTRSEIISTDQLVRLALEAPETELIVHRYLLSALSARVPPLRLLDAGENLAFYVALAAARSFSVRDLSPIFAPAERPRDL